MLVLVFFQARHTLLVHFLVKYAEKGKMAKRRVSLVRLKSSKRNYTKYGLFPYIPLLIIYPLFIRFIN
jgi:hypothetical protein